MTRSSAHEDWRFVTVHGVVHLRSFCTHCSLVCYRFVNFLFTIFSGGLAWQYVGLD